MGCWMILVFLLHFLWYIIVVLFFGVQKCVRFWAFNGWHTFSWRLDTTIRTEKNGHLKGLAFTFHAKATSLHLWFLASNLHLWVCSSIGPAMSSYVQLRLIDLVDTSLKPLQRHVFFILFLLDHLQVKTWGTKKNRKALQGKLVV